MRRRWSDIPSPSGGRCRAEGATDARTLMDETGYGAGGRWRVRLPLGVSSPRMSLIGWPRRTLDCRHGEAVLAVEPGALRREYPFLVRRRRARNACDFSMAFRSIRSTTWSISLPRRIPPDRVRREACRFILGSPS